MIELPYPPSVNRMWRNFNGRMVLSTNGRKYKAVAALTAKLHGVELMTGLVAVTVILHPKKTANGGASKTRIDLDNALKCVLDSLNGVAYHDDKQVVRIYAEVGPPVESGGVSVVVIGL